MRTLFAKTTTTALAVVLLALPLAAYAGDTALESASEDGVLVWRAPDGSFKWWIDARAYIDMAAYFDDGWSVEEDGETEEFDLIGGTFMRRARFAVKAELWTDWYAEVDIDFAEEATALKDAYVAYRGLFDHRGQVRVGNFRQPFGLEENFTSRNLMFLERSTGTEPFVVGRRMGVEVSRWDPNWRVAVSIYGADVADFAGEKDDDEPVNFAARVNVTPINEEGHVLLAGAAGTLRRTEWDAGELRFDVRPETYVADVKFTDTDDIEDVDDYRVLGTELAYVNNRLYTQGEYMLANVDRVTDEDLAFSGGYVYAGYFLTDDTHPYDHQNAEFGRVLPSGRGGAWEVTARYSSLDLTDEDISGGCSNIFTVGLNWYANPNVRVYLNYSHVNNHDDALGRRDDLPGDYDFGMFQTRFLASF